MAERTVREDLRDEVRSHYARVASQLVTAEEAVPATGGATCCGPTPGQAAGSGTCCGAEAAPGPTFGASLYSSAELVDLPVAAVGASLGCGNPILLAELREGERVLDLGSGGGIDVLLAARRVGDDGFVYGVDMTDEMLRLAWENAGTAGVENASPASTEDPPARCRGRRRHLQLRPQPVDRRARRCRMYRCGRGRTAFRPLPRTAQRRRACRADLRRVHAGAMSRQEYLDAWPLRVSREDVHAQADGIHGTIRAGQSPRILRSRDVARTARAISPRRW
jgi:hypothetical protein